MLAGALREAAVFGLHLIRSRKSSEALEQEQNEVCVLGSKQDEGRQKRGLLRVQWGTSVPRGPLCLSVWRCLPGSLPMLGREQLTGVHG